MATALTDYLLRKAAKVLGRPTREGLSIQVNPLTGEAKIGYHKRF